MHNGCSLGVHAVWARPRSLAATDGVTVCFPFLEVLRCFSSLGRPSRPMDSAWNRRGLPGGVAPFGDPRIRLLPTTRGFSQVAASFFASRCQGIRRALLLAWPKNLARRLAVFPDAPPEGSTRPAFDKPSIKLVLVSDDSSIPYAAPRERTLRLPSHSTVKDPDGR
jgi:hypothetical protein